MQPRFFAICSVLVMLGAGACKSKKPAAAKDESTSFANETAVGPSPSAPAPLPPPPDIDAPPSDASHAPSGMVSKVLARGHGRAHPAPTDRVRVHFTGWKKDGTMFDSTLRRGEPATFEPSKAIPGFREALALMVEGEKRRLWLPEKLAYGERGPLTGQPAGDLVFDLELLAIER